MGKREGPDVSTPAPRAVEKWSVGTAETGPDLEG